ADPFEARRPWIAAGVDHVEAARRVRVARVGGQEQPGGADDAAAFAPIDGRRAAAMAGRGPVAHFHEDQHCGAVALAVEHHQVEFAKAEAGVCRHRTQAGAQQVFARGALDRVAALAGAAQPPPSGTTWPPLKVAQAGVRWTLPKPSMRRVPVAPRSSASAPVTRRSMNAVSSQASWPNANR